MALQRDARYPGRWTAASAGHPQGAFKNRSAPGALDGSYIEQDWANDWDGFFSSLISSAGVTANGVVDAVGASQYFSALATVIKAQASGRLLGYQIFTTSGTYAPSVGMGSAVFRVQGGGAAGAGLATPSAGNVSIGAPGTSGSYAEGRFLAASIGASQSVTIGAGGIAGSNAAGGNGGTTSVGSLITAPGGVGGSLLNNQVPGVTNGNGGLAGTPTGANIFQSIGTCPGVSTSVSASSAQAGAGGASMFGNGGTPPPVNGSGVVAQNYGAGGSGVAGGSGSGNLAGGAGKSGIVIVLEFV